MPIAPICQDCRVLELRQLVPTAQSALRAWGAANALLPWLVGG